MNQLQDLYEYLNKASMSGMSERSANHVSAAIAIIKQMMQAEPVGYVLAWNDMDYVGCVISGTRHKDYVPVFAAPQVLPVGFVLVPVEPTPEMISAGRTTPMPSDSEFDEDDDYRAVYKAMLAAAPKGAV